MQFCGIKHPDIVKSIELMGKYVIPELSKREKKPDGLRRQWSGRWDSNPTTFCLGSKHSTSVGGR